MISAWITLKAGSSGPTTYKPGCTAGLDQAGMCTVTVGLEDAGQSWPGVEAALRQGVAHLRPGDPLWGVADADWPGAMLAGPQTAPTTFAHWVAALCIAFQRWAHEPAWQARVLRVEGDSATLALPCFRWPVLDAALQLALRHVLIHYEEASERSAKAAALARDLNSWLEAVRNDGLAPNTLRAALAALARGMPVVTRPGFIQIGWGAFAERLESSFTGRTGNIASRLARDKHRTKLLLSEAAIPVPQGTWVRSVDEALQCARAQGWPVVIKPADLDGGLGVVPGIRDEAGLRRAFEAASQLSAGGVVVERHVDGADHRLLVVDGRLWAAARRTPAGVSGDGTSSVAELVERVNRDPQRGRHKRSMLMALELDEEGRGCLAEQGLDAQSVPGAGRFVHLRRIANIGSGGTAEDVLGLVHPDNRALAERAARCIGLDIAGIDLLCPDISRSWMEVGGAICEVNAQPGFRVHWLAEPGRDLNGELIDWLFRDKPARIPTAAITGTNGKTTVARMLHHIWLTAGCRAGVCTTQGVWVGQERLTAENLSGHPGGRILLNDPSVEVAVLEMPRKGLLKFGHPCDRYDVAALLNVQDDHIGVDGIHSLQAMAELKAEVLERATGAVVVNAEDPLALAMLDRTAAPRRILVASRPDVPALREHLSGNGEAVYAGEHIGQPWIVQARGGVHTPLMPLHDVAAWMGGLLRHNAMNALFAAALAWAQGVDRSTVRRALATFANTPEHNPGRYNFIEGLPFRILLDYGHNPDGVAELCAIASSLPVAGRRRLLSLQLGNRHRQHLDQMAPQLARSFDHIVLGCDPGYVSRCPDYAGEDPVRAMLNHGLDCLLRAGLPHDAVRVEPHPGAAVQAALEAAEAGDLLVMLVEPAMGLPAIERLRKPLLAAAPGPHSSPLNDKP